MLNRRVAIEYHYPLLRMGIDFSVLNRNPETGQEDFQWFHPTIPCPTEQEMSQWEAQAKVIENRRKAYPPIGDQLDMIYHDKMNNTTVWTDTIQSVKETYPKL
jgi:hypothetical protein